MNIKQTIIGMMILVTMYLIVIGTFKGSMWAMSLAENKKNTVEIHTVIK